MRKGGFLFTAAAVLALVLGGVARADDWWPHPADATWTYQWTDSVYNQSPTKEAVTVKDQKGKNFTLTWTTKDQGNSGDAPLSFGDMAFQETTAGLVNTGWASNPPPPDFPILCPQIGGCNNSLASTMYYLIWGSRSPVLAEPLLQGTTWQGTGGAQNDVSSTSSVPGHGGRQGSCIPRRRHGCEGPHEATQAGALGDPYGTGVRTVWWVFGVGPVKMTLRARRRQRCPDHHFGAAGHEPDAEACAGGHQLLPAHQGAEAQVPLDEHEVDQEAVDQQVATIDEVVNNSARFTFHHVSGPIKVAGSYGFSTRTDGVTNIWGLTKAATAIRFPALGPKSLPAGKRRHFFTPFDLMNFGFNPLLTAYPAPGQVWGSKNPSRDFSTFGVNGSSKVLGIQKVKVPGGTFDALVVRASLSQPGFKFGSGTRTSWFAPGKGLVKLVFHHRDGSVSTVVLLK